jgi:ATP-dependent DNA ligase
MLRPSHFSSECAATHSEEKYDGYRILAYKQGRRVRLISRRGRDWTQEFRDVAKAVAQAPARTAILDGEVVVFDRRLVSRFELLRDRAGPLIYPVFDCLYLDGCDLRREALSERRRLLEGVVEGVDRLIPARRLAADGLAAYRQVLRAGYEGMVAKDEAAPYAAGRSARWIKVKPRQEAALVICGFRGETSRFEVCFSAPTTVTNCTTSAGWNGASRRPCATPSSRPSRSSRGVRNSLSMSTGR